MTRTAADIRRWQQYLADERAEAAVYRELAARREGEEQEILLALAAAEARHEQHWANLLGEDIGRPRPARLRVRALGWLARMFGGVFVLALAQTAEAQSGYALEDDATPQMVADERIHEEVVRGLATRGRNRMAGTFRAAVFGANDGLVSNLALVMGIGATGVDHRIVLMTGLSGLLAGALSMGAGEFISVRSQRELLEASTPGDIAARSLPDLDVDANELALVYRTRGMSPEAAEERAQEMLARLAAPGNRGYVPTAVDLHASAEDGSLVADVVEVADDEFETHGTAWGAAFSSFCFFAVGALIPVLPWIFGAHGTVAEIISAALVGLCLLATGATTGLLSGTSPVTRAVRQLAIGLGAAAVTYGLGLVFDAT